jgi:hypothetical protein
MRRSSRLAFEKLLVVRFQALAANAKARIDWQVFPIAFGENSSPQILQYNCIKLRDRFGSTVVALHQLFTGQTVGFIAQAKLMCQYRLMVKQQAVFAASSLKMQANSQRLQEQLVALDFACLGHGYYSATCEITPVFSYAAGPRNPKYGLQIAQSASALLNIGFKIGLLKARMALLLFELLCLQKCGWIKRVAHALGESAEKFAIPDEQPRFQEIGLHRHILRSKLGAIFERSHTMTDLKTNIP